MKFNPFGDDFPSPCGFCQHERLAEGICKCGQGCATCAQGCCGQIVTWPVGHSPFEVSRAFAASVGQ